MARCPAHEDRGPSLSVAQGHTSSVLFNCFAGCSFEQVRDALPDHVRAMLTSGEREAIDAAGAGALLHNRGLRPETIRYFRIEPDIEKQAWRFPLGAGKGFKYKAFRSSKGGSKYWFERGAKIGAYHLRPCDHKPVVWLVEGEPDVWVMQQAGLSAFCFTNGSNALPKAVPRELAGMDIGLVNLVYDQDDAGQAGAHKIAETLRVYGIRTAVKELPHILGAKGDITDLYGFLECDDEAFRHAIERLEDRHGGRETDPWFDHLRGGV